MLALALTITVITNNCVFRTGKTKRRPSGRTPSVSRVGVCAPGRLGTHRGSLIRVNHCATSNSRNTLGDMVTSTVRQNALAPRRIDVTVHRLCSTTNLGRVGTTLTAFSRLHSRHPRFNSRCRGLIPGRAKLDTLLKGNAGKTPLAGPGTRRAGRKIRCGAFHVGGPGPRGHGHSHLNGLSHRLITTTTLNAQINGGGLFATTRGDLSRLNLDRCRVRGLRTVVFRWGMSLLLSRMNFFCNFCFRDFGS